MAESRKSPTEEHGELTVSESLKRLGTDPERGLSSKAVKERLEEYGYNEVP